MGEARRDTFVSVSGEVLDRRLWLPSEAPKAVLQLAHGMAEHIDRYEQTAQALTAAGYAVVGHTHMGHGQNAKVLGNFGKKDGWDVLIQDTHALRQWAQAAYPGIPYFLLGHSMGSFVVRGYCLQHEQGLAGVILSGTGHFDPLIVTVGNLLASLMCALGQGEKPSPFLASMSNAGYNKTYANVSTSYDWLSSEAAVVDAYIADPFCGFHFTARGYRDMFRGLARLYPGKLGAMDQTVPVLLLSGSDDPVGAYGPGVEKVAREIEAVGVGDVTVKLYPGGRHEMFNEKERGQVWADLIAWMDQRMK